MQFYNVFCAAHAASVQAYRQITITYRLTFKKRANVPDLGGTAAGELADGELHQEQRHAAQHQAREIGQQKGA